jgi:hypothetical protein
MQLEDVQGALAKIACARESIGYESSVDSHHECNPDSSGPFNWNRLVRHPFGTQELIAVRKKWRRFGVPTGYYSWVEETGRHDGPVFRMIVLDTRAMTRANGRIDAVQLGWLFDQLHEAHSKRQYVVLFAHHAPQKVRHPGDNGRAFRRVLDAFPNIIAYFYGHSHWNETTYWRDDRDRFLLIQTGSIADFPPVGRAVGIGIDSSAASTATLSWNFFRPQSNAASATGLLVQSLLAASHEDSLYEHVGKRVKTAKALWNVPTLLRSRHPGSCKKRKLQTEWEYFNYHCLAPSSARVRVNFVEPEMVHPGRVLGKRLRNRLVAWREWLDLPLGALVSISHRG